VRAVVDDASEDAVAGVANVCVNWRYVVNGYGCSACESDYFKFSALEMRHLGFVGFRTGHKHDRAVAEVTQPISVIGSD